jgi:catechol 2,3-dioxygenase-like lactoylglutathione lyase family enzyme
VSGRDRRRRRPGRIDYRPRVEQRISVITLGVDDLERSRRFYEALGWRTNAEPGADVVFFQAGGAVVALWSRAALAEDSCTQYAGGWGGVTLAYNTRSPGEVDSVIAEAEQAGGTIARPAGPTFWGGYSGVFADPDGHPWEVAHNPHWRLRDDGSVDLS